MPLFQGAAVVPISPGQPSSAVIPIVPIPARVQADRDQLTLVGPGAMDQLAAAVLFATGDTIDGLQGIWVSGDPTIAAVTPTGLATGVRVGMTRLEARFDTLADTVDVAVTPPPSALEVRTLRDGSDRGPARRSKRRP